MTFRRIYDGYEYGHVYEGGEPERYLPTWNEPTRGLYVDCPQLMAAQEAAAAAGDERAERTVDGSGATAEAVEVT